MNRKWYYVVMVAVAIAISYFDRQTLPVAIAAIQRNIPLSNQQFSYLQTSFLLSYAAMYVLGGRLLDMLGFSLEEVRDQLGGGAARLDADRGWSKRGDAVDHRVPDRRIGEPGSDRPGAWV